MGAVFALFSGWYFWIPKILGLDYNLLYSKAHFWVLFTGVKNNEGNKGLNGLDEHRDITPNNHSPAPLKKKELCNSSFFLIAGKK